MPPNPKHAIPAIVMGVAYVIHLGINEGAWHALSAAACFASVFVPLLIAAAIQRADLKP